MAAPKQEIIEALRELRELVILDEQDPQSFRVRAYEGAIHGLEAAGDEVANMSERQLTGLHGVGKSTAKKIREFFDTGRIAKTEALRKKYPPSLLQLSRIPSLGPKSLAKLRSTLGIESLDDLKAAIADRRIRELPGFGEKTEANLLRSIERLGLTGKSQRTPIARAMPVARRLVGAVKDMPGVQNAEYCGSLRRLAETIGDIDIVVAANDAAPIMAAFVALPQVDSVLGQGETKSSIVTHQGLQVDLRVVKAEEYGAALLYFTGSKTHNIALRQRALARGWTLNEYALSDAETGDVVASRTEAAIFGALGLPYIPPPMREATGEIAAAEAGELPEAIEPAHLKGDLHVHTTLSGDGRSALEEVVAAAKARGYEYIAITDHAEDLALIGVSREQLLQQRQEIESLRARYPELAILQGAELNIGPDGGLDYDAEFRAGLDWCVAAVHDHFDLDRDTQTRRILRAMEDPSVNAIGHLTARKIGRRPPIELDYVAVLKAAARTGTAIEINAGLARLDAPADVLRQARSLDVTLVISTDSHHVGELERMQWGALHAQRGWVSRDRVANCWPRERFLEWVRSQRA